MLLTFTLEQPGEIGSKELTVTQTHSDSFEYCRQQYVCTLPFCSSPFPIITMRQHNATSNERNCWGSARERSRMKARYSIRQRVSETTGVDEPCSAATPSILIQDSKIIDLIQSILHAIIDGNRAYFSVNFLDKNANLVASRIPSHLLYEFDGVSWIGQAKLLSRFGREGFLSLRSYAEHLDTFTLLEYAIWLRRYHIVGSFLLGGVPPCVRGTFPDDVRSAELQKLNLQLQRIGKCLLRKFLCGVPLTLQTFLVKRAAEARVRAWESRDNVSCSACQHVVPMSVRLQFPDPCRHVVCECCFWKDILENLDKREDDNDVALCPVCALARDERSRVGCMHVGVKNITPAERYCEALLKYRTLPLNSKELRKSSIGKKRVCEKNVPCSSWSTAVLPSLGNCQEVRRDKFFGYVEKGAYHYVKGCLKAGIDLNLQNEYGHTALYTSVWTGNLKMLKLLLRHGGDPMVRANGGSSITGLAIFKGSTETIDILREFGFTGNNSMNTLEPLLPISSFSGPDILHVQRIIPISADHAGAGASVLDSFKLLKMVDGLLELWKRLPNETPSKSKHKLCSTRKYFCDTECWLTPVLTNLLLQCDQWDEQKLFVWPHMRFLCYQEAGAVLAPHVDLCRAHPEKPTERSTHSFLLYLTDCEKGGETTLLRNLIPYAQDDNVLGKVSPRCGRLLLFPHHCPHQGERVVSAPKLLIRGEVRLLRN
jgi:hypothetical protein